MSETGQQGDPTLAVLYNVVCGSGGEMGLTMLIGGAWMSGQAVSPRSWWNQLGMKIDDTDPGYGDALRQLGLSLYPTDDEVEAGVAGSIAEDLPVDFIHLRDARLFHPGTDSVGLPTNGTLVRVRISEVQAWSLGFMGPPGYTSPMPIA